jgi:hypothetical protein
MIGRDLVGKPCILSYLSIFNSKYPDTKKIVIHHNIETLTPSSQSRFFCPVLREVLCKKMCQSTRRDLAFPACKSLGSRPAAAPHVAVRKAHSLRPNAIEDLIDEKEYEYVSGRMLEVYRLGKVALFFLLIDSSLALFKFLRAVPGLPFWLPALVSQSSKTPPHDPPPLGPCRCPLNMLRTIFSRPQFPSSTPRKALATF